MIPRNILANRLPSEPRSTRERPTKAHTIIALTLLLLLSVGCSESASSRATLNGAGASFPAPVYQAWSYGFSQSNAKIQVNYQSIGSGAGISQIKSGTIDFAGTDNPLQNAELEEFGLKQFPMLTGGVVVIVNLPNLNENTIKLDKQTLADIFLGKIQKWNAQEIVALNPEIQLPDLPITIVHRSDSSGTTFLFTQYLSAISPEWKEKVGEGASVKWPVGVGGQKNPGVCNNVSKIAGSIGYTEYTYAVEAKLACADLENADGKIVSPSLDTFQAAATNADWSAPGFLTPLSNQPGEKSWTIVGVTYILVRSDTPEEKLADLKAYFQWCFESGGTSALKLHYVPIPQEVAEKILESINNTSR
ncbi:MAG: phosphate ABC transporter substrate-binding protein PstS [Planctomycetia bacterium]|nr:phosphate ABC transporter substrate-binding protein PstS [Planctomycetia bacterium]